MITWLSHREAPCDLYRGVLKPDQAGGFVAFIPALPGCVTQGADSQESLDHLKDALEGWLDCAREVGLVIPLPEKIKIG